MKKQKTKMQRNCSIAISIFSILITLFLIFFVVVQAAFPSKSIDIFGIRIFTISYTKSMEPKLKYDDMIVVRRCDFYDIEVGDIISFEAYLGGDLQRQVVTHRVHEIVEYEGRRYLITMGDNVKIPDIRPVTEDGYDNTNVYIGKFVFKSTIIGQAMAFLRSRYGILLLCELAFCIILIQVINIVCKSFEKKVRQAALEESLTCESCENAKNKDLSKDEIESENENETLE